MIDKNKHKNLDDHASRIYKVLVVVLVSVLVNFGLAFLKLVVGLKTGSLCIMLDSTNSFLDVLSGIVTIIAFFFVLSGKDDNGIGYGRGEYLATFVVSAIVVGFGIAFFIKAIERLITPVPLGWSWLEFGLMCVALVGKILLYIMFHFTNRKLHSTALKALTVDSIMDVCLTFVVTLSLVVSRYGSILVDVIFGIILSIIITISGLKMMYTSTKTIVGVDRKPDAEFLKKYLLKQEGIEAVGQAIFTDLGYDNLHAVAQVKMKDGLEYSEIVTILDAIKENVHRDYNVYLELSPTSEIKNDKKIINWKNGKKLD